LILMEEPADSRWVMARSGPTHGADAHLLDR